MKTFKELFLYIAAVTAFNFVIHLPYRAISPTARLCACILWLIPPIPRLICANIRCAFPDWDKRKIRKTGFESLFNMLWNIIEFCWTDGRKERIERCCVMPDILKNKLDNCKKNNVRMIYVNPHHGSWEGSGLMATYYGQVRLAAVAKPIKNYYVNKFFNKKMRGLAAGFEVIFARGAMRSCLTALKEGKSLAIPVDQNTKVRDGGVFVNFFGLPVPGSTAPAALKKYCDMKGIPCTLMYGVSLRKEDGKLYSMSEDLPKPFEEYANETEVLQALMDISEKHIRMYPEQYLWLYHRFMYIPPDSTPEIRAKYPYYAKEANKRFFGKFYYQQ